MTKTEYIKAKAVVEAMGAVLQTLRDLTEEQVERRDTGTSEYSKMYETTKWALLHSISERAFDNMRLERAALLRDICNYEIDHPHDVF